MQVNAPEMYDGKGAQRDKSIASGLPLRRDSGQMTVDITEDETSTESSATSRTVTKNRLSHAKFMGRRSSVPELALQAGQKKKKVGEAGL